MSRLSFLGIGAALTLILLFWSFFGIVIFIGYGAYGFKADIFVIIWGVIFLGCLWGTFASFRRAFKSPRKSNGTSKPESVGAEKSVDVKMQTADEKLAALLKPPKDPEGK